jgi:UDP-N-acetylmuramoylalanine--D-glutamate ligase
MLGDSVFEFVSYELQPAQRRAVFHYKTILEDKTIDWAETIIFPQAPDKKIPKELVQKLLESLHIILGVSYWKFYCATDVKIPYQLTKEEANFWNIVYKKGLGEFFYKNNLDPKISPKFPATNHKPQTISNLKFKISNSRCLVGIGGGKDSIVSAELLKQANFDITAFHIETQKPSELVNNVIKMLGAKELKIQRFLDPKVYEKHLYNGHIPISAVYAFLGLTEAIFGGYRYFIVSNEHSSNFGNITYKGLEVNHQWSKSFEFEQLMQDYLKTNISSDVGYFSLLRPFYEIRIAKLFSTMEKYFPYFSSCNRTTPTKRWCGNCAKCVFVWAILSPYIVKEKLVEIFGKDLSADEKLQPLFKDILGQGSMKPFDCVGTFEEVQTALKIKNYPEVFKTYPNATPEPFRFLGMETVAINRAEGMEGKSVAVYLKKYWPKLKIVTENPDITIKTPGINKSQIAGPYTTPTNIFFSQVKEKHLIIGVTGSKGKSTTSSLIYHILKTAGKNAVILGNIGKPMIDVLLKPIRKDTIFVIELSSFQLDDIHYSPDIAVITNLFPEHMDFHGSLKNYYEAKKNIYRFQKPGEHLIDRPKAEKHYQSNLLGEHNQNNIQAAVEVSKILKIPQAKVIQAIKTFKGLPHRLENVGTYQKITFYDDAISTTPDSTIMAIKALKNIDTIFLGGQDRGYKFTELEKTIKKYKIKNIVLFPDSGKKMLKSRKGFTILETKSMNEAVTFAYKNTAPGKICLLSCASPSYSLWKNFEEKGDQFKAAIKQFSQ